MKLYGSLESLLEYSQFDLAAATDESMPQSESTLGGIVRGKRATLADLIHDISRDIGNRLALSSYILAAIYNQYTYVSGRLHALALFPVGAVRSIEQRRSGVEAEIDRLKQEAREERVKSFQDVAKLKQELRTWLKQYLDAKLRENVVSGAPVPLRRARQALPR